MSIVRTRFAPSPTGGLHLGGVRTALFSYLYAKKHNGQFVLRIEDTDQTRFVEGAEDYIVKSLEWCGILPDESPQVGGPHAPYRQSERKNEYRQYAEQLVASGHAYYAFDTTDELTAMRENLKTAENTNPQYDGNTRMQMRNSLSLSATEVQELLAAQTPYVIRIKMPSNETLTFHDLIRDEVSFDTNLVDDKVLLKADGMPTYHLAVVVDDYLMQITHAFRGEEWLPSAPVHILLWKYLGWENAMPKWAHLPLILKPDGNGKLSKRDGERLGFPVFALDWHDTKTNTTTQGFKDRGFLPEAFINILVMLGWSSGTEQEIFTKEEIIQLFDIERVHKGGAKFDFEKAKWYNNQWIHQLDVANYLPQIIEVLQHKGITIEDKEILSRRATLVKERCTLLEDFAEQLAYFYKAPTKVDIDSIQSKWTKEKTNFFEEFAAKTADINEWNMLNIENEFKALCTIHNIKPGEVQLPLRIMLVGAKFGPSVFIIAEEIGPKATAERIENVLQQL